MDEKLTYAVWIRGKGWLRGEKDVLAFASFAFALQVAKCLGWGASVRFVDQSAKDLERIYLEHESRSLWHIFRNLFAHKNNTSNSKG